jgi:hypothetical protein
MVVILLAALAAAVPAGLRAQSPISIDQFSRGSNKVDLQFTDQRYSTNPVLNHLVQFSSVIGANATWTNASGGVFSSVPTNSLGGAASLPATNASGFYRVVGIPFPTTGTNLNAVDSDGDGFTDALELQYGTDPNNPNSFPVLTSLPRAQFALPISTVTEGSGGFGVTVLFDKPYFGSLKFGVSTQSTASVNIDYLPLPATVAVAGNSVVIPITWIDDAVISPVRVLFLQLLTDPALPYARGNLTRHTGLLNDNDAYWSGVLVEKYSQRNFRLKVVHVGGGTQATFVAGAGNDGLSMLAGETNALKSDQSSGVVPIGSFPATVQFDTTSHFKITSPAMRAATGGLFGSGAGTTRSLVLDSLPPTSGPPNNQQILPLRVVGTYTETLVIPGRASSLSHTGMFVLVKDLPARPTFNQ